MFATKTINNSLPISIQTLGWFHNIFEESNEIDSALKWIKKCGFNSIDYHFENYIFPPWTNNEHLGDLIERPIKELLDYFSILKSSLKKHKISLSQSHGLYHSGKLFQMNQKPF